jgi:phage gp46-like protein
MSDIALIWSNIEGAADMRLEAGSLATDAGLNTAIIISMFSDARAREDDVLPGGEDRRGWWADALSPSGEPDPIGSRLWLLAREKRLPAVIERARFYTAEALDWLVRDGVAASVTVTAEAQGADRLAIGVEVRRPDGRAFAHRYDYTWEALS